MWRRASRCGAHRIAVACDRDCRYFSHRLAARPRRKVQPPPPPSLSSDVGNIHLSTSSSLFDLSSRFLRMLGNEAAWASTGAPSVNNPTGGGADMQTGAPTATQRVNQPYRAWFEGYGLKSRMDPQNEFRGDRRETWGGVAGFGVTPAPGVSFGVSVDQGRSKIRISPLAQEATVDLTQIGGNAAFESGPWTLGAALIHGFGEVDSRRGNGTNVSVASYDANLWGALAELSYLWSSRQLARRAQARGSIGPRTETSSFTETGGTNPVIGSSQVSRRVRILAGAEIGHTWFGGNQTMFDLSGYARAVDIVSLEIDPLLAQSATGTATSEVDTGRIGKPLRHRCRSQCVVSVQPECAALCGL